MKVVKKIILYCLLFPLKNFGQADAPLFIDNTAASSGITRIEAADLNNDNLPDVVVTQGYSIGNLSYYLNNGNGGFSARMVADPEIAFAESFAVADFNNDGWKDIAAISRQDMAVYVYLNDEGNFPARTTIDSGTFFLNHLVAADFDADGTTDIVAIGQHSIDLYRNGNGSFTKEHILTTATSPNILECMDLVAADMNADGFIDLVTAETIGPVVYYNSGLGIFTPHVLLPAAVIARLVATADFDNDGDTDIVSQEASGQLRWFSNLADGTFNSGTNLFTLPALRSLACPDTNHDGLPDIFTAYANKAVLFTNTRSGFSAENILHQDNNLFINEVAMGDLDLDGMDDFIWSGVNHSLAYQPQNNLLSAQNFNPEGLVIYPNPGENAILIDGIDNPKSLEIYDESGKLISYYSWPNTSLANIAMLPAGVYMLKIKSETASFTKKFIKK